MKRIVFCDFDGTITAEETFVAMFKEFAPEVSAQLLPELYARRLTLRDGVRQIVESIPSQRYSDIIEFTRPQPKRAGFVEFLDFLEAQSVPLVVVSGGLRGMVEAVLGDLTQRVQAIYALDVSTDTPCLRLHSAYEEGTELMAKVKVMAEYTADEKIAIGDSLTDLNMALHAPVVFARDRLATYLDEHETPYIAWTDFFDIRDRMQADWG